MNRNNLLIYGQLALGMAIFGSGTPISKIVTNGFPVFIASGLRMVVAALLLAPFAWSQRDVLRDLSRKQKLTLGGIALIGMFLFSVFMLYGMQEISGVVGSIIMSTTPAITAFGAFLFLNNKLGWRRITAIALAVIGVLVLQISSTGDSGSAGNVLLGSVLIFLAVCSEAAYTLLGRVATQSLEPILVVTVAAVMGALLFLFPALYQLQSFDPSQTSVTDWLALVWWGGGTLALGTLMWYRGVSQVQGGTAAGFMGVMPVSALVLSYVLLGEAFRPIHLVGFGIVFAGVLLISWSHYRESQASDDDTERESDTEGTQDRVDRSHVSAPE